MFFADMAQDVLQMPGVRHDAQHEELQRLQQITLLQCVSTLGTGGAQQNQSFLKTVWPSETQTSCNSQNTVGWVDSTSKRALDLHRCWGDHSS